MILKQNLGLETKIPNWHNCLSESDIQWFRDTQGLKVLVSSHGHPMQGVEVPFERAPHSTISSHLEDVLSWKESGDIPSSYNLSEKDWVRLSEIQDKINNFPSIKLAQNYFENKLKELGLEYDSKLLTKHNYSEFNHSKDLKVKLPEGFYAVSKNSDSIKLIATTYSPTTLTRVIDYDLFTYPIK